MNDNDTNEYDNNKTKLNANNGNNSNLNSLETPRESDPCEIISDASIEFILRKEAVSMDRSQRQSYASFTFRKEYYDMNDDGKIEAIKFFTNYNHIIHAPNADKIEYDLSNYHRFPFTIIERMKIENDLPLNERTNISFICVHGKEDFMMKYKYKLLRIETHAMDDDHHLIGDRYKYKSLIFSKTNIKHEISDITSDITSQPQFKVTQNYLNKNDTFPEIMLYDNVSKDILLNKRNCVKSSLSSIMNTKEKSSIYTQKWYPCVVQNQHTNHEKQSYHIYDSMLEAKFAMFFKHFGIDFIAHPCKFHFTHSETDPHYGVYTPDAWIKDYNAYIEYKPRHPTETEMLKCQTLAMRYNVNVICLYGSFHEPYEHASEVNNNYLKGIRGIIWKHQIKRKRQRNCQMVKRKLVMSTDNLFMYDSKMNPKLFLANRKSVNDERWKHTKLITAYRNIQKISLQTLNDNTFKMK